MENFDWLVQEADDVQSLVADALNQEERNEFEFHWGMAARPAQLAPPGNWRTWLIMAGRGFGKTRAGAEWVRSVAEGHSEARIALISSSLTEARAVMVEGESGLLECSPPERRPIFEASLRRVRYPNGAQVQLYSAAEPESLRGPQHSHAFRTGPKGVLPQSIALGHRRAAANLCDRFHPVSSSHPDRRRMLPGDSTSGRCVGWARR